MSEVNFFGTNQTYKSQINSESNDDQSYLIEQCSIKLNAFIIIIPIEKRSGAAEVEKLKIDIER